MTKREESIAKAESAFKVCDDALRNVFSDLAEHAPPDVFAELVMEAHEFGVSFRDNRNAAKSLLGLCGVTKLNELLLEKVRKTNETTRS